MMRRKILHMICILKVILLSDANSTHCLTTVNFDFHNCTETMGVHYQQVRNTNVCLNPGVCHKSFNISLVNLEPFNLAALDLVKQMLGSCCGNCGNITVVEQLHEEADIKYSSTTGSDFIFPVLGRGTATLLRGFHFIPLLTAPAGYYFTRKVSSKVIMKNAVQACINLGPFFIICILMALVSGFICWVIEKRHNEEEFPQAFHTGLFQGFWWSFVSMTTVGYGDKAPKSWITRTFAVLWILVGITICSMLTASLTTAIQTAKEQPIPKIAGKLVGAIKHRTHDAKLISHNGGNIVVVEGKDVSAGIQTLFDMLQDESIDGFLLDRYTFYYLIQQHKQQFEGIKKLTIRTKVENTLEKSVYGMLLRNTHDYTYFYKYFSDNWLQFETCTQFMMNINEDSETNQENFFSPDGEYFLPALYISLGVIGFIFSFGMIYELRRNGQLIRILHGA